MPAKKKGGRDVPMAAVPVEQAAPPAAAGPTDTYIADLDEIVTDAAEKQALLDAILKALVEIQTDGEAETTGNAAVDAILADIAKEEDAADIAADVHTGLGGDVGGRKRRKTRKVRKTRKTTKRRRATRKARK
jgi:hypothetical protein